MRLDLHIHSVYSISPIKTSSSSNSLKGIVKYAKLKGLGGFAISDHNNIVANEKIKKLIPKDMVYVPSCEISSKQGHILAYGIQELIPKGLSAIETVEKIKEQGALAIAAHPYNVFGVARRKKVDIKKFDGLEVFNAHVYGNSKSLKAAKEHKLIMTAGSDAHILRRIGNGCITVPDNSTLEEVFRILKKRKNGIVGRKKEPITGEILQDYHAIKYNVKNGFKRV